MLHSLYGARLPAGLGIYPLGSLLNHACSPNAIQSFDGRELRFRVIRPIRVGQEITVPYMDLAMTRAERRLCLHLRYFFDIGPVRAPVLSVCTSCTLDVRKYLGALEGPGHVLLQAAPALQLTSVRLLAG